MSLLFQIQHPSGSVYGVDCDGYNFTVVMRAFIKERNELSQWRPAKAPYHSTLEGACKHLLKLGFEGTTSDSIGGLVWQMNMWCGKIEAAVRELKAKESAA